jgi:hypothetical protein
MRVSDYDLMATCSRALNELSPALLPPIGSETTPHL